MGITLQELADMAGVSKSTASRCLNDSDLVSPRTKARIRALADAHGFAFNAYARSLSTQKSQTIGLIYPPSFKGFDTNLYYAALHDEIRLLLEKAGYDVILSFARNASTQENNIIRLVRARKVDGFLIAGASIDAETLKCLQSTGTPFVLTHYVAEDTTPEHADVVCSDNYAGGRLAAEYLLRTGHRRIAAVMLTRRSPEFLHRLHGITDVLQDQGLPLGRESVFWYDEERGTVSDFVGRHWDVLRTFDAILAGNDTIGIGLIQGLQLRGLRIPEDLSIVGYDDTILAQYSAPAMTSVHPPREAMAAEACRLLLEIIAGCAARSPQPLMLPPTLTVRASTKERI